MIYQRLKYHKKISDARKFVPIVILTGARQVGKTTLMETFPVKGDSLLLTGQDPETAGLFGKLSIIEKYLVVNLNKSLNGTILIDEFQYIPDVATILKLLVDKHKKLKIICTGSSSLDIYSKISESLAGRVRVIPVFPLSFSEYLLFKDKNLHDNFLHLKINDDISQTGKVIIQHFDDFLIYGGLPRVALAKKNKDKTELLSDIYSTYLVKDVRNYLRNEDVIACNKVLKLLAAQFGNLVNINEIANSAKISHRKCEEYIFLLEQMYIIFLVTPYNTNKRREITKMKKVYFYDNGIRNIIYNSFNNLDTRVDNGALFENFVFTELLKERCKQEQLYFYRTKDGQEIDFVVDTHKEIIPIEVKYKNFESPKRIIRLNMVAENKKFKKSIVVNKNLYGKIDNTIYLPGYFLSKLS